MDMVTKNKFTQFIQNSRLNLVLAVSVSAVVVVVGVFLVSTFASGFFASLQASDGTVSGNAQVVTDSSASGGKSVQFNAPASTGGGGGTTGGTCLSGTNVPGGTDPLGGCWPGPNNTGVPKGTTLTAYTGPCVITVDNTVVDSKTMNCSPVQIQAKNVVIKNSKINGQVYINSDDPRTQYNMNFSLTLQDSEVAAPLTQEPAVFEGAMTILRANIYGGITSVQCGDKSAQCNIKDSWLHGQLMPQHVDWHLGGFHSIGGGGIHAPGDYGYKLIHNSVICDTPVNDVGGGCSGDIVFIPNPPEVDSTIIQDGLIQHNLMGASTSLSYCLYGGDRLPGKKGINLIFKDNVFNRGTNGKCGDFGPVAGYGPNTGNQWINNTWDDGGQVDGTE